MGEFERLKLEGYSYGYYNTYKMTNGQTASIFFLEYDLKRGVEYSVVFAISTKKKHIREWLIGERDILTNENTGKCGVEGLLWAKKQITSFEEFIKKRSFYKEITICIYWSDSRRRNVYTRTLGKIGYEVNYRHSSKCLSKKVA